MDFYSSRTNCSLIPSAIGNIIEHHTEKKNALNDELFSLFRVANRTFAATKGQMSLVKVVRFTYIFIYI